MFHSAFSLVLVGVLIGLVVAALTAVLVMLTHGAYVKKVETMLNKFTQAAYEDVAAHKQAVVDAITGNSKQLTQLLVDTKKDVEVLKTRVGGAFSVPEAAEVSAPNNILTMPSTSKAMPATPKHEA